MRRDLEAVLECLRHRRKRPRHLLVVVQHWCCGSRACALAHWPWILPGRISTKIGMTSRSLPRLSFGAQNRRGEAAMNRDRIHFLFLNIGHFLDHMFTLIFATVAALALIARMGPELRRSAEIRDARLLRLRPVLAAGRLARRQVEPRRHDGGVLRRHRARRRSRPAFAQTPLQVGIGLFVDRRVRRDLSSGRPRDRHAATGRTPACGSR